MKVKLIFREYTDAKKAMASLMVDQTRYEGSAAKTKNTKFSGFKTGDFFENETKNEWSFVLTVQLTEAAKGPKLPQASARNCKRRRQPLFKYLTNDRTSNGIQPKGPTNVVPFSRANQTRETIYSQKCLHGSHQRAKRVPTLTGGDRTNGDNALERAQGLHVTTSNAVGRGQDEVQRLLTRKAHEKSHKRDEECGDSAKEQESERAKKNESKRDLAEPHDR